MNKYLILIFFTFWVISLSSCSLSINNDKGSNNPVDGNSVTLSDQFKSKYDVYYKKDDDVYLNTSKIAISKIKPWFLFDNNYLFNLRNDKNYIVVSEASTWAINNKTLNLNWKTINSRYFWFSNNYLFNGKNVAYYKCEKLIYFSNTNTNDCLANQIWLDDKFIDSIDMEFFNKNRKYPFHLKYLDDSRFIYQKWDKFYSLKIGEEKPTEDKGIEAMKEKYKNNEDDYWSFNFIGFIWDKTLYSLENYWNAYDDILTEKIKALLFKNWIIYQENKEVFDALESGTFKSTLTYPSLYWEESSSINFSSHLYWRDDISRIVPEIYWTKHLRNINFNNISDLYLDGSLYDSNLVAYKVIDDDIFTVKYENVKFEEENPRYFGIPKKSFIQSMLRDTSESHLIYTIYKNKNILGKVEFKSSYDFGVTWIIKFIDSEKYPCVFNKENNYWEVIICLNKWNFIAQTTVSSKIEEESLTNTGTMNTNILIWNGIKLNLDWYNFNSKKPDESYQVGVTGTKFQPFFDTNGDLRQMMVFWTLTNEAFKEMVKVSNFKEDEMFKYIAEKTGIKDISVIKKADKEWEDKLTPMEKIDYEKAKTYTENLGKSLRYWLFTIDSLENWNFSSPPVNAMTNISDFYGVTNK